MADKSILSRIFAQKDIPERPQAGGSRFALGWPMLAALCLVLVCAVAWAFYMGYMVGRGQSPQAGIHEITGLMKPDQADQTQSSVENEQAVPADAQGPVGEPVQKNQEAPPAPRAEAVRVAPQQPARQNAQPKARVANQKQGQFAYTFQLAAIREQAEAQRLQKALQAKSVRTSLRKSGKVYLVLTELRGGQTEVEQLTNKLKSLKLGKPLQISRKPLDNKRK